MCFCQQAPSPDPAPADSKRILGLIPNYKSSPSLQNYVPLTVREKFRIASQDSFDRGTVALALIFAGEGQLTNSNRSFGQGAEGFGKYFGTAYGDFLIGDYMTDAVFPIILHQDPRYFRRGTGSVPSRIGYAIGHVFRTQTDSGRRQFNFSEVVGNSAAVAISTAYYPNQRTAADAASSLGIQIGIDAGSFVLEEFWPDLQRKFRRRHDKN